VLLTADLIDYWVRRQVIEFLVAQEIEGRRDPCIKHHAKEGGAAVQLGRT
jgi:hypothetical protein